MTGLSELLDGKRAIVTGADRGIGAGIARTLAKRGARVCLNVFGPAGNHKDFAVGIGGFSIRADVRVPQMVQRLVEEAGDRMGGLDILVNNAGVESIQPAALKMKAQDVIQSFVVFRNRYGVPIWLGESGENSDVWIHDFVQVLEKTRSAGHFGLTRR